MKVHTNGAMNSRQVRQFCALDSDSMDLMERAMNKFGLSARAHSRILKIARTIADLAESERIRANHVAEAIQYRTLDRRNLK
jgi:magnesium chelatase family protein